VVECARTRLAAAAGTRILARAREGVDWATVVGLAERHRVTPLVHRALVRACPERVPPATLATLRRSVTRSARQGLALAAELRALLADLAAHEATVIPYKGPVLAVAAYGELGLRVFGDLDLVVAAPDLPRVRARLLARGYRPQLDLAEARAAALAAAGRSLGFVSRSGGIIVELHSVTALDPPLGRLAPALREGLASVVVAGAPMPSFAPDAVLAILCVHGAKHAWSRLLWICDVAELLRASQDGGQGWDWGRLLDWARRQRTERALLLGLRLARDLLDAPLPDGVASRLASSPAVARLAAEVAARLFTSPSAPGLLASARFQLRLLDVPGDRLRYCRRVLAPGEADMAAVVLPGPLSFLYYPLRLSRLVLAAARGGTHR
jgi:putative nucleotidyltransferase-like protein